MEWARGRQASGYGYLWYQGVKWLAHRLSWKLAYGEIPEGMIVCHKCDNRVCINPEHLFVGTYSDNANDMVAKGRDPDRRGEKGPRVKLSEAQAIEIMASAEPVKLLASRYGVSRGTISQIKSGARWGHLEGERVVAKHYAAGKANPMTKLTDADVEAIRAATGVHRVIAERFGVSQTTVSAIKRGAVRKQT